MKKNGLILFSVLHFIACADALSGNNRDEELLFNSIEKGMDKEEVLEILGEPDVKKIDSASHSLYHYYFTRNKNVIRSGLPTVIFDSLNQVKFSSYH